MGLARRRTALPNANANWTGPTAGTAAETIAVLDDHGPFGVLELSGGGTGGRGGAGAFRLKALNHCVLARRRVDGAHPEDRLPDGAFGTELRYPLDRSLPRGPAICVMTSDRRFADVLVEMAGLQPGHEVELIAHDTALLGALDALPAFDPYLVHARLARVGLGSFSGRPGESHLRAFERLQAEHFRPAVRMGLAVRRDGLIEQADDGLVDRTWNDEGMRALARLVGHLGVDAADVPGAIDGWEALACFALRRSEFRPYWDAVRAFLLHGVRTAPTGREWVHLHHREPFERALTALDAAIGGIDGRLATYAGAYRAAILDRADPRPMREVLEGAARSARQIGGLMTAVSRAVGCWQRHGGTLHFSGLKGPTVRVADLVGRALVR